MSQQMECSSADGRKLILTIQHYDSSHLCSEFTVEDASAAPLTRRLAFTSWFVVLYITYVCVFDVSTVVTVLVASATLYQLHRLVWGVKSETLLVISLLGLQITTTFLCGSQRSRFIPWHCVSDIVINEAVSRQRVVYYLAVVVQRSNAVGELVPLFQQTTPRLSCLEHVYQGVRPLLGED